MTSHIIPYMMRLKGQLKKKKKNCSSRFPLPKGNNIFPLVPYSNHLLNPPPSSSLIITYPPPPPPLHSPTTLTHQDFSPIPRSPSTAAATTTSISTYWLILHHNRIHQQLWSTLTNRCHLIATVSTPSLSKKDRPSLISLLSPSLALYLDLELKFIKLKPT